MSAPVRRLADARAEIMDLVQGYTAAQALLAANRVGLLEALAAGPAAVRTLPRRLACSPRGIRALLDALAGLGLVRLSGGRASLQADARPLFRPGSASYLGDVLRHQQRLYDRWGRLERAVRTGAPVARARRQQSQRKCFLLAMVGGSQKSIAEVWSRVDLSGRRSLLDLGGGLGAYAAAAAVRWPHLACTLFDLPAAVRLARPFLRQRRLTGRVRCIGGDARRDDLGGPYEAILISNVLHMFSPQECVAILKRARRALARGGVLLVKDFVLHDDRSGPRRAGLFGLNMLLATEGGGVLADAEYVRLFARAGLERTGRHDIGEGSRLHVLRAAARQRATASRRRATGSPQRATASRRRAGAGRRPSSAAHRQAPATRDRRR